eukprot:SAG11_NODE_19678_length_461_cov_1.124309_1_plen_74_part_10
MWRLLELEWRLLGLFKMAYFKVIAHAMTASGSKAFRRCPSLITTLPLARGGRNGWLTLVATTRITTTAFTLVAT